VNVNVTGTLNLLQALQSVNYASFLYISTSDVYGNADAPFAEDFPLRPNSPHSFGKASAELLCKMLYQTYGQPATVIRPFLTFGPAQKTSMLIPSVMRSALAEERIVTTRGEQCRDVSYVDDIVQGLLLASTSKAANGEVINIGSGVEISVRDLVRSIVRLCSRDESIIDASMPYRPNEIWHMCADNSKARRILGWSPEVPLEAALIKTISWYRENPDFE
jgi:dTDP-glucose 4,6-dehydratase